MVFTYLYTKKADDISLRSVAGPVIQGNGRLTFADGLRSEGLLCFTTQQTSSRTGLAESIVTLGEPGDGYLGVKRCQLCLQVTSRSAK